MTNEQAQFLVEVMRERDALKARVVELEKWRDDAHRRADDLGKMNKYLADEVYGLRQARDNLSFERKQLEYKLSSAESSLAASRRQAEGLREAVLLAAAYIERGKTYDVQMITMSSSEILERILSALDAPQPEARDGQLDNGERAILDEVLGELYNPSRDPRDAIIAEAVEVVRAFLADGPTETDADACPHCYGEHHVEKHRGDCPYVAARAFVEKHGGGR